MWRFGGAAPGFFFQHADQVQLTCYQFWVVMAKALETLGLKGVRFGTHSFRIGAASTATQIRYPKGQIKAIVSLAFFSIMFTLCCHELY